MSFQSVQASIAKKEGVPMKNAGAILASASRNASAAKERNTKLRRVPGKASPPGSKSVPMGTMGPQKAAMTTNQQKAMMKAKNTSYSKLLGGK